MSLHIWHYRSIFGTIVPYVVPFPMRGTIVPYLAPSSHSWHYRPIFGTTVPYLAPAVQIVRCGNLLIDHITCIAMLPHQLPNKEGDLKAKWPAANHKEHDLKANGQLPTTRNTT